MPTNRVQLCDSQQINEIEGSNLSFRIELLLMWYSPLTQRWITHILNDSSGTERAWQGKS